MDDYDRAIAAGDKSAADRLLREATYAATQDGTAPDSVTFNPSTGRMEDLSLSKDPKMFKGRAGAAMQGAGQGVSFGGMDEVVGAAYGVTGPGSFAENRDYAQDVMRSDLEKSREQYPVTTYGTEIAGGALSSLGGASALGVTAPAAKLAAQARQGAALGAVEGGVYGALSAQDGPLTRAAAAARGAGMGGLTGAGAPLAMSSVRNGFEHLVSNPLASMRKGPDPIRASRAVQTVVDRSGRSIADIAGEIEAARLAGQSGYAIADASGNAGQRMLAGAARTPGDGRQGIIEFLTSRQEGQGRRIAGALDEALNAPRNPAGAPAAPGQAAIDFRRTTAAAATQQLENARNTAANAAYDIARREAGPVDIRGALDVIDDRIAPMQGSGITGDGIDAKLSRYRSRMAAQPGGSAFPDASSVELSDFNRILGLKQDISDDIGAAVRAGRNNEARVLTQLRESVDAALEQASSAYRGANDEFARASRVIDQVKAGGQATSAKARVADTLDAYAAQSPEGQAAFRVGYTDPVVARIENAAPGVDKSRPLLSDGAADELRAMAKDPEELMGFLRRESNMHATAQAAMGGSKTADNMADSNDIASAAMSAAGNAMTGNFGAAARRITDSVLGGLSGRNTATREQIAQLLLSGDIREALAPAIERELQMAMQAAGASAGIRAAERSLGPQ